MESGQAFQKHMRFSSVDVHPTQSALIVNYELEVTVLCQLDDTKLRETKERKKFIKIKNINEDTDVKLLAADIITKCNIIPHAKQHEIEQLLYYLQTRKQNFNSENIDYSEDAKFQASGTELLACGDSNEEMVGPNIGDLDDYIELLYDGIPEKIKASSLVLKLARVTDNLSILTKNDALIGALARVLREDGRKSIELSTNIAYTFFCLSAFRQFHSIIAQHKIGSLCMEMIEIELRRYDQWIEDIYKKKDGEDDNLKEQDECARRYQKYASLIKKQDQLLRVCFYLLYNISEDPKVEIKIVNRGIVGFLSICLKRESSELLILVLTFLKKLSVYIENKVEIIQHNVIENVGPLISHRMSQDRPELVSMALRLLWNLSFDIEMRNSIVKGGFMPKLVKLLSMERFSNVVLGILYHISMEDRYKSLLTYVDCIPIVISLILASPEPKLPMLLIAFGINLAINNRNAQVMADKKSLPLLMERALKFKDALLMKMIRNISQHEGTKDDFLEYVDELCNAIVNIKDNDDFVLECLGTLSNIASPQIDFEKIFIQYHLLDFMKDKFSEENVEDDFLFEIIMVTGATAIDEACASMILESGIMKHIIDFLNAKQEDDEIVLQVVYLFYRLILHPQTRKSIIEKSTIPAYLMDLMHDKNPHIKKFCGISLDLVVSTDEKWAKKIKDEKFCWHNSQWLEMIKTQQIEEGDFNEDSYTPCIQENDLLNQSDFLYSSGAYEGLMSEESLSPDEMPRDIDSYFEGEKPY